MFTNLPPVTKALLIANCAVFALQLMLGPALDPLMLWPWLPSDLAPYAPHGFMPWQLLTHGFMHSPSNIAHLLFNMLALLMFGAQLEYAWGQRRFLTYFLVCVVGAGLCQLLVVSWGVRNGGLPFPTVGASGGVFGLLLAYGMMFPNQRVMLLIPPVPMKARTLVIVYGLIELVLGVTGTRSGVAHFAHLGGMLFGWLLIRHWRGQPPFGGRRIRRVV
ncbi:rhomboid family intramembrane serine protease [uncultured Luteimonas sp.]|uniref:rhomboid family intramembrane serine protease n=1 Tax=uncultured Luteimonas sp. TaxID=453144 RepID=UPI00261C89D6|nr:rhomboid family intramembrane serine protease [uncultured Luteimonas sp.]